MNKPMSISLCDELKKAAEARRKKLRMTRSEFFRMCVRAELARGQGQASVTMATA